MTIITLCWQPLRYLAPILLLIFFISGCGQGVGTGGTGSIVAKQYSMGGAIQGTELSLSSAVSTIAGSTSTEVGTPSSVDGIGAAARFNRPYAITSDGTNLYVADSGNGLIRKVAISTGSVTTLAGTAGVSGTDDGTGTAAKFVDPRGITTDGINLFVTDACTIRKIVIATGEVSTLAGSGFNNGTADGIGTAARFDQPSGITTDGTYLYITEPMQCSIRRIDLASRMVMTVAGIPGTRGNIDGPASTATFSSPGAITTDGTNLYVAQYVDNSIRKINIVTGEVSTLGSTGPILTSGGVGLFGATGITRHGTSLYITDVSRNVVTKMDIASGTVTTLAGSYAGSVDGIGTDARFFSPTGITTDGVNLYLTDTQNDTIRQIAPTTATVTTLAGAASSAGGSSSPGGSSPASLHYPLAIATDGDNLYIAEAGRALIGKVVISTGEVASLPGGPAEGITTDGAYVYVTDSTSVRKIQVTSKVVTTLAGSPNSNGNTDGIGTAARFGHAAGITTDGKNLYVADSGNATIRKVEIATGIVTTLAGNPGVVGSADGIGSAARFSAALYGITTDGNNLYVLDGNMLRTVAISDGLVTTVASLGNGAVGITTDGTNLYLTTRDKTVARIAKSGQLSTIAGSPGTVGSTNGTGSAASFTLPTGITTDGKSLYVVDSGNNTIRKIQ